MDRIRERSGARPSVDLVSPDLRVNLRLMRERATVAIDLSGEPLHRRGYRQSGVEAPLKENLAAALLLRCGWPAIAAAGGAFVDPMCGSGHAGDRGGADRRRRRPGPAAAALRFRALAAARARRLGGAARGGARATTSRGARRPGRFRGYDRDQTAIRASLANAERAQASAITCSSSAATWPQLPPARRRRTASCWSTRPTACGSARPATLAPHVRAARPQAHGALPGLGGGRAHRQPAARPGAAAARLPGAHVLQRRRSSAGCCASNSMPETVEPDAETIRARAARGGARAAGCGDVRQPAAQELPAPRGLGEARGRRVLPRLRRRHARVRLRHRPLRQRPALGLRAGIRGAGDGLARGGARPTRRGARGAARGAGLAAGAHRAARPPPAARRRAVREGGRGGRVPRRARGPLPVPRELHRLPRHGAVPRPPADAAAHRGTRGRAIAS